MLGVLTFPPRDKSGESAFTSISPPKPKPNPPFFFFFLESSLEELLEEPDLDFLPPKPKPILGPLRSRSPPILASPLMLGVLTLASKKIVSS